VYEELMETGTIAPKLFSAPAPYLVNV